MKVYFSRIQVAIVVLLVLSPALSRAADAAKPNILFILTDDLGYGDVGVLYQNSRPAGKPRMSTPNLDQMAAEGLILRQHYTSSPVCAPARASLLLGQHQGDCGIRDNQFDKTLPNNHTLATVLKQAGYHTAIIGKYGLAGPAPAYPGHPLQRGFDEFYGVLGHGPAHFHYPGNSGKIMDMLTPVTSGLENAYDTDLYAARAKKFIMERASASPSQPFFLYLAFTAPHFFEELPTQAYPAGRGVKGGLQWPLNTNSGRTNSWYHPDYAAQNWPDVEKRHATMIRRVDDAVGDILQLLRDLHMDTNTLVVFTSDNGPHNEDGQDPRFFDSWGAMDGIKRDLWEAGIREPTIVRWPGHIAANTVSDVASCFWDWMPTFAELGGLAPPAQSDGVSLVPTLTGTGTQRSRGFFYFEYAFTGHFKVDKDIFQRKHVTKRGQLQAIRMGDLTAVRYSITNSDDPFRLYNVVTDPHEDHNLAANPAYAAQLAVMRDKVKQVRLPDATAPRPYDNDLMPSLTATTGASGLLDYAVFQGVWPWVPDFDALTPASSGGSAGLDLDVRKGATEFGLSFKGYIKVPTDGEYTFSLTSDGGAQMWIHDAHLIEDDFHYTTSEVSASVRLKAGLHPIRIFYRHRGGPLGLSLKYSGPGIAKQEVPVTAFYSARDGGK